ncbi:MAG: acetyl-CoA carboxylase carboxyltransferase subunit alpha [Chloroflexi bacterium]|nr:acetyl-CoA carboxylase carboxyltransferase subunit alpha [Chloroflexota bacterium]
MHTLFHRRRQTPDDLWVRCGGCHDLIYRREFDNNLRTCPRCNFHERVPARRRIEMLLDEDTWNEEDVALAPTDPLGFVSLDQTYADKLVETQRKTGLLDAMVAGRGEIEGHPVRLAVCDFGFLGASMGSVVGEKIARAAERSASDGYPLILVSASGGARMHEGIYSLMQMAKTSAALARLAKAQIPCFSVLTDPTTGGVTASFASLGDVILAEPGALIGFAGPRVIEQTTRQKLPPDAQRSDFLLKHGMIDAVVHRRELRSTLGKLLRLYPRSECGSASSLSPAVEPNGTGSMMGARDAWETVQTARNPNRPFTLDYIGMMVTDFVELHGDRQFGDDPAIVGGIGSLDGRTVVLVGHQKGRTTQERMDRRFGMARPEGYRKALRLMHHAERFGFPVITFIDTPGADPTLEAEERGQAWAIAQNLAEMAELSVPVVGLVIGEGGSGGALAIGVADRLLMLENATYSVVSPEGCASILWNDSALAPQAAVAMKLTAQDLVSAGIADGIIPEPAGGAHEDFAASGANVQRALVHALRKLDHAYGTGADLNVEALLADRFTKYRNIGLVLEPTT